MLVVVGANLYFGMYYKDMCAKVNLCLWTINCSS